jgi:low temperature requirement protein LtrA
MAVSTDQAFKEGVLWFAIPYIGVRLLGLGLQFRVTVGDDGSRGPLMVWFGLSLTGLAAVLGGGLADPAARVWWWLAAIVLDLTAGMFGGKKEGWNVRAKHFSERHSLIVIIALGESLIVAASAVSASDRTIGVAITGGFALLVTCLLWWSYFALIREHMEDALDNASGAAKTRMGRDVFSFIHYPLVCGIIGIAIGFEKILSHPEVPLTMPVALALGGGVILFVGSTAASLWRASGIVLVPRLIVIAAIAGCTYLFIGRSPEFALGLIGAGLILMLAIEWRRMRIR